MIKASRLCRPAHSAFDGAGSLVRAGRWNQAGYRVVYVAESEALAALEVLVHLSSPAQIPDYVCLKASIPESIVVDVHDFAGSLPVDWNTTDPRQARAIGTQWLIEGLSAVLRVPSIVIPRESNFLINPGHPSFPEIVVSNPLPFEFDIRLLRQL